MDIVSVTWGQRYKIQGQRYGTETLIRDVGLGMWGQIYGVRGVASDTCGSEICCRKIVSNFMVYSETGFCRFSSIGSRIAYVIATAAAKLLSQ